MTCLLVAVLWGQSFEHGLYKVCVYDCGQERPAHVWFDRAYPVHPKQICPAKFSLT